MRTRFSPRALAVLVTLFIAVVFTPVLFAGASHAAPAVQTQCFDDSHARSRTEIDTDLVVPQFDPALGELLDVALTGPSIHLDTDAVFESTAATAAVFAERMDYLFMVTSPGGLPSPTSLTGSIQRVPMQTLAAFDGALDFLGPSSVAQPSTALDDAAANITSTDPAVLSRFTGTGTMAFHLTSTISETFTGGGGNVQAQINTFASAAVQVCYRYQPPDVISTVVTPPAAPPPVEATLPLTGGSTGPLTVVGVAAVALGVVLARRNRAPQPSFDL